jgi:hypothetical protein
MFSSIPLKFLLILFMFVNYVWTEDDSCVKYSSVVKIKIVKMRQSKKSKQCRQAGVDQVSGKSI